MSYRNHPARHVVTRQWLDVCGESSIRAGARGLQPARSVQCPTFRERVRRALDVFWGRADALYWVDQP